MMDVTGKELQKGDTVVYTAYKAGVGLRFGVIERFTPTSVRMTNGTLKPPHFIAKVEPNE